MRAVKALLFVVMLPGCATIVEGSGQSVTFNTTPPGASCAVDRKNERLGTVAPTPGALKIEKSRNELMVTCSKEGYQTASARTDPRFVGTTFFNFIIGGGVGFIVDAASGANFKYPNEVGMNLVPAQPTLPSRTEPLPGAPIVPQPVDLRS